MTFNPQLEFPLLCSTLRPNIYFSLVPFSFLFKMSRWKCSLKSSLMQDPSEQPCCYTRRQKILHTDLRNNRQCNINEQDNILEGQIRFFQKQNPHDNSLYVCAVLYTALPALRELVLRYISPPQLGNVQGIVLASNHCILSHSYTWSSGKGIIVKKLHGFSKSRGTKFIRFSFLLNEM